MATLRTSRAPLRRAELASTSNSGTPKGSSARGRVLRLTAVGFKPHPQPNRRTGDDEQDDPGSIQQYSFKVLADMALKEQLGDDIISEHGWVRVNPRGRKLASPVMDAVEKTWNEHPTEFYRINRGIVLSADSVKWDKDAKIVEIVFTDRNRHGILDGAHSLAKIVDDLIPTTYGAADEVAEDDVDNDDDDSRDESASDDDGSNDRYISCEVWVGLTKDQEVRLSAGRNTSRAVPAYAISNLRGDFKKVELRLQEVNSEFLKKVAFKPNEQFEPETEEDEKYYKPVAAINILQLMMCMDVTNYSETDQPIEAYKNQGYVAKFWDPDPNNDKKRIAEYHKMLPVLGDLLELYDTIRETIPEVYDNRTTHLSKIPRKWTAVLSPRKTRKKGQRVDKSKREILYYLDPSGQRKTFRAPTALFFPIMCAFRSCLKVNGKGYEWFGGKKPTAWKDSLFKEACLRLAVAIASLAKQKDSLHAVGRDEAVWIACYNALSSFLFEYGIKPQRS
jgi:hypothetical protein